MNREVFEKIEREALELSCFLSGICDSTMILDENMIAGETVSERNADRCNSVSVSAEMAYKKALELLSLIQGMSCSASELEV